MQHFISDPTDSVYACGADASNRQSKMSDTLPSRTTCLDCRNTLEFRDILAESE